MRFLLSIVSILSFAFALSGFTYKKKKELASVIDKIVIDLEYLLTEDWYVVPNASGFDLNYCPSCMDRYKAWKDSSHQQHLFTRADIFEKFGPDSVYIHSMVSIVRTTPEQHFAKTVNNGILQYKVSFVPTWDSTEINRVQAKNDALAAAIFAEPVYKTSEREFSDYRRYVPKNWWKERTEHLGYTEFERLPYSSTFYDYSIFIDFGDKCYSCRSDYIVSRDQETKTVKLKYLAKTNFQTQLMLAYVLGIPDFFNDDIERHRTFHSDLEFDIELR